MTDWPNATIFPSQLEWMGVCWSEMGIFGVTFGNLDPQQAHQRLPMKAFPSFVPSSESDEVVQRLTHFAAGDPDPLLDLRLDLDGMTEFQKSVIRQCRRVPSGSTVTYQQLAERAGFPGAARAVGSVMAKNRIPLIVPCHRVVSVNGLGGFSAPDGLKMKRRLLANESKPIGHGASNPRASVGEH